MYDLDRHAVVRRWRNGAASAPSGRPSSGRPAPRWGPCCPSRFLRGQPWPTAYVRALLRRRADSRSSAISAGRTPARPAISAACWPRSGGASRTGGRRARQLEGHARQTDRAGGGVGHGRDHVAGRHLRVGERRARSLSGPLGTSAAARASSHRRAAGAANTASRMARSSARWASARRVRGEARDPRPGRGAPSAAEKRAHCRSLPTATASSPSAARNVS